MSKFGSFDQWLLSFARRRSWLVSVDMAPLAPAKKASRGCVINSDHLRRSRELRVKNGGLAGRSVAPRAAQWPAACFAPRRRWQSFARANSGPAIRMNLSLTLRTIAQRMPGRPAVSWEEGTLSYAALEDQVQRIAGALLGAMACGPARAWRWRWRTARSSCRRSMASGAPAWPRCRSTASCMRARWPGSWPTCRRGFAWRAPSSPRACRRPASRRPRCRRSSPPARPTTRRC